MASGAEKCREVVVVDPPPRAALHHNTHWICLEQSFYTEMPKCIGITSTGTVCCCTGAFTCRLKETADVDSCSDHHSSGTCFSLVALREQGCGKMAWCRSSGRATDCFVFESKFEGECAAPHTCCKFAAQECCCDYRVAIPPDQDVPIACACCGYYCKPPETPPTGWHGSTVPSGDGAAPAQANMM